jgi:hypothetical protein
MSKTKINMVGGGFQHINCSSHGHMAESVDWVKDGSSKISIHIDNGIINNRIDKSKKNYAWLSESKTIIGNIYNWCFNNVSYIEENYEMLFTHDIEIANLSDKFHLVICSAKHWVQDIGIHQKHKLVSMIASNKIMCQEHQHRQKVVFKYRNDVDLFGRGFNEIQNKEIGLKHYYFSIAMENGTYPLMYSEKLTDCFAMGTIPIYYGTPKIGEVFNTDGIILLTDDFDVKELTPEFYQSKIYAIKDNFEIATLMPVAEDYIYNNFIK